MHKALGGVRIVVDAQSYVHSCLAKARARTPAATEKVEYLDRSCQTVRSADLPWSVCVQFLIHGLYYTIKQASSIEIGGDFTC